MLIARCAQNFGDAQTVPMNDADALVWQSQRQTTSAFPQTGADGGAWRSPTGEQVACHLGDLAGTVHRNRRSDSHSASTRRVAFTVWKRHLIRRHHVASCVL